MNKRMKTRMKRMKKQMKTRMKKMKTRMKTRMKKMKTKKTKKTKRGGTIKRSNRYLSQDEGTVFYTFISLIKEINYVIIGNESLTLTVTGNDSFYLVDDKPSDRMLLKLFWISSKPKSLPKGTDERFSSVTKEDFNRQVAIQKEAASLSPQIIFSSSKFYIDSSNYENIASLKSIIDKSESSELVIVKNLITQISNSKARQLFTTYSWGIIAMEFPIGYNLYSNETFTSVEKKDILITLFKVMIEFAIRYKKINTNLYENNVIVNKKTNEAKMFGFNWIIDVDTPEELKILENKKNRIKKQLLKDLKSDELEEWLKDRKLGESNYERIERYLKENRFVDTLLLIMKNNFFMIEYLLLIKPKSKTLSNYEYTKELIELPREEFIERLGPIKSDLDRFMSESKFNELSEKVPEPVFVPVPEPAKLSEKVPVFAPEKLSKPTSIEDVELKRKYDYLTRIYDYLTFLNANLITKIQLLLLMNITNMEGYSFWKKPSRIGNITSQSFFARNTAVECFENLLSDTLYKKEEMREKCFPEFKIQTTDTESDLSFNLLMRDISNIEAFEDNNGKIIESIRNSENTINTIKNAPVSKISEISTQLYTNSGDEFIKFARIIENSKFDEAVSEYFGLTPIGLKSMIISFSTLTLIDRTMIYMYFVVIDKFLDDEHLLLAVYKVFKTFKKRWAYIEGILTVPAKEIRGNIGVEKDKLIEVEVKNEEGKVLGLGLNDENGKLIEINV